MEKDFFELYERHDFLNLEIYHNSITDWNIIVYDKRGCETGKSNKIMNASGPHRELVFAKVYCQLAKYLNENFGGY